MTNLMDTADDGSSRPSRTPGFTPSSPNVLPASVVIGTGVPSYALGTSARYETPDAAATLARIAAEKAASDAKLALDAARASERAARDAVLIAVGALLANFVVFWIAVAS